MTLVTYFDLELYHMDIKIIFFNGDIDENLFDATRENFVPRDVKKNVYKLKKFIYGLKHASH